MSAPEFTILYLLVPISFGLWFWGVLGEGDPYPMDKETTAIGLSEFLRLLPSKI